MEIIVEQNNDKSTKGKLEPRYGKLLGPDTYDFESKNFTAYFISSITADNVKLILRVKPWNNCVDIYKNKGIEKCLVENFRRPYDRTTEVSINNISLKKIMTEAPLLQRSFNSNPAAIPTIDFKQIDASEYRVHVKEAKEPFILVLSQLFDPAWKIYIDGNQIRKEHFLANTYANGWVVDKIGDYNLTLKFTPQDLLLKGEIVSFLVTLVGLGLVLIEVRKKYHE